MNTVIIIIDTLLLSDINTVSINNYFINVVENGQTIYHHIYILGYNTYL